MATVSKLEIKFVIWILITFLVCASLLNDGTNVMGSSVIPGTAWQNIYGEGARAAGTTQATCLIMTNDGGYAIAGIYNGAVYLGKIDSSGNMQWNHTYQSGGASAVLQEADGGYSLVCDVGNEIHNLWNIGGYFIAESNPAIALLKTDASGNLLWNRTLIELPKQSAPRLSGCHVYGKIS